MLMIKGNIEKLFLLHYFLFWDYQLFFFLGFSASAIGAIFFEYQSLLNTLAGLVIMLFGLHFLNINRLRFLDQEARFEVGKNQGTAFGSYVLGLAFAFGWTPCIGPQLGAILSLAASNASIEKAQFYWPFTQLVWAFRFYYLLFLSIEWMARLSFSKNISKKLKE